MQMLHNPLVLLAAGVILNAVSYYRFASALIAWFSCVPFVIYMHSQEGWKSLLSLYIALMIAGMLGSAKIMTDPMPPLMLLMFGVPAASIQFARLLFWKWTCHSKPEWLQALGFAASMVVAEYLQHMFTTSATWGAAAYTQVYNLPFLQLASIFGMAGPSFLIYWFSALIGLGISTPRRKWPVASLTICAAIVVTVHLWGTVRLDDASYAETVMVAAVGSDATSFGCVMPQPCEDIELINESLFERSKIAARAGARLISWVEGATGTMPEKEDELLEKGMAFAQEHAVEMVLAYLVLIQLEPLKFENKAVWIRPDGSVDHSYLKNEPVPNIEPAIRGEPKTTVVNTSFGRSAVAICYDFDFPYIGKRHALGGVQLAVVPAWDWEGIDPTHTQMAAVRAIEGGFSLLRTTGMGLSAGIDQYGQIHGRLSANQSKERLLLVTLPIPEGGTIYTKIADVLVYACAAFLVLVKLVKVRAKSKSD